MANKKSFIPYKAIVKSAKLNVRPAPTKAKEPIRIIQSGDEIVIYDIKGIWGKISKTKNEWVMLEFVTRI